MKSDRISSDNNYLQLFSLLMLGTRLKLGLMLRKQIIHRCNNVQWLIVYARWLKFISPDL